MRLISTSSFALVVLLTCLSTIQGQIVRHSESFDPSGSYHPILAPPGDSDKFFQFALRASKKKGKLEADGEVRGNLPWLKFYTKKIDERGITFVSEEKNGIRYEFTGNFLEGGNFARRWVDTMVTLEGDLRKFVRGEKLWEYSTKFAYYPPH